VTPAPAIRVRGIVKRYPGVVAVDGADFDCERGEVHALAGENGAGKTTLMRILYGMTRPDEGTMELDGIPYAPAHARAALARGVGMVHQHFMLIPPFTVLDNAMLGAEPRRAGLLDRSAMRERIRDTCARFGLQLDPDARVEDLSVGEKQRLEILKVLLRGARTLILDEPTAVLVPSETRALFATVSHLAADGAAVVFITHRLHEVIEHADRVTVMRRGRVVGTVAARDTDERALARMMVGRDPLPVHGERMRPGDVMLRVEGVGERDGVSPRRLDDVSFRVRSGEIVAIAGVEGNGQRELAEILAGMRPFRGEVVLGGRLTAGLGPGGVRALGFAHIPEDRLAAGVIPSMTVAENLLLGREKDPRFRRRFRFDFRAIRRHVRERIEAFDIRPPRGDAMLGSLSGGNQQKVVIAREAEGHPRFLLAAHPTRGVDVGAAEAIHQALLEFRNGGTAILLVSADLSEVRRLADRILVLYSGRLNGEFRRGEADEEELGARMIGAQSQGAA
jgi:general nucleoside transport system ATP-binding protein